MVLRNQLLGELWVVDPLADPIRDVLGELRVGVLVHEDLDEVLQPDPEPGAVVEPVPQLLPLLGGHLVEASPVGLMLETARRSGAGGEDLIVPLPDLGHFCLGDRPVVQRRCPVGPALEDREMCCLFGHLGDQLDGGRAGADHGNALALELDRIRRPVEGVECLAFEIVDPIDARHRWNRQRPDRGEDEPAGDAAAVTEAEGPDIVVLVPVHRLDVAVELDVLPQVELLRHEVEVLERLGLRREHLGPVPLVEEFLAPGVAVGEALRVEPGPGITVAIPGSSEIVVALQNRRPDTEIAESLDLVEAADPRADHDDVVVRTRYPRWARGSFIDSVIGHVPPR